VLPAVAQLAALNAYHSILEGNMPDLPQGTIPSDATTMSSEEMSERTPLDELTHNVGSSVNVYWRMKGEKQVHSMPVRGLASLAFLEGCDHHVFHGTFIART